MDIKQWTILEVIDYKEIQQYLKEIPIVLYKEVDCLENAKKENI